METKNNVKLILWIYEKLSGFRWTFKALGTCIMFSINYENSYVGTWQTFKIKACNKFSWQHSAKSVKGVTKVFFIIYSGFFTIINQLQNFLEMTLSMFIFHTIALQENGN